MFRKSKSPGKNAQLFQRGLAFLLSKFLKKTVQSEFRAIFLLLQDSDRGSVQLVRQGGQPPPDWCVRCQC